MKKKERHCPKSCSRNVCVKMLRHKALESIEIAERREDVRGKAIPQLSCGIEERLPESVDSRMGELDRKKVRTSRQTSVISP